MRTGLNWFLAVFLLSLGVVMVTSCSSTDRSIDISEDERISEQDPPDPTHFQFLPEETEARFVINEVLQGNPKTVVGISNSVSGEIRLDIQDPSASALEEIRIASDSFLTDSSLRDGAIKRFILQSDEFAFISFKPISIEGLPQSVELKEQVMLILTGELTIRDVTRTVQFEADVKVVQENRLEGYAAAVISRSDFNLSIPEVPQVAQVDDQVLLEFEFTAQSN